MLIAADWVLPVSRPPIREGAVLVENGVIVDVGRLDQIELSAEGVERHEFPDCVITPGLVNAHTHLSLSALGGLVEPKPFEHWLSDLVRAMSDWGPEDHAASASWGAHQCLLAGVTVVGDITYGTEARDAAVEAGLGGAFFWEVLGVSSPALWADLERRGYPTQGVECGLRAHCGLSPHSPYTSGPRLLQVMHETAADLHAPFAIHVAESAAEEELMWHGTGPLAAIAERNAHGFTAPGCGPVAYLDRLGVLDNATVVHAGHITHSDIARLAATTRGVVACPRSNAYLSNPVAPVSRLLQAGIPVGIGTDSAASNEDLDLMRDVRALHDGDPSIPAAKLIEAVTVMGALSLGLEDRFGILERGMRADMSVFAVGSTADPEVDFVRSAGADNLRAVLSEGEWRVQEGRLVNDTERVELAARASRVRAEHSLGAIR